MTRADPHRKTRQARAPEAADPRPRRQSLQDALDGEEPEDDPLFDEPDDALDLDDDIDRQELAARREEDDE